MEVPRSVDARLAQRILGHANDVESLRCGFGRTVCLVFLLTDRWADQTWL